MYRTLAVSIALAFAIFGLWTIHDTMSQPQQPPYDSYPLTQGPRLQDQYPHHLLTQTPTTSPYKAPLVNEDVAESEKVVGSYGVFLRSGCTYQQHKSNVGQTIDLEKHTRRVFTSTSLGVEYYTAVDISKVELDAIRADTEVAFVEHDMKVHLVD